MSMPSPRFMTRVSMSYVLTEDSVRDTSGGRLCCRSCSRDVSCARTLTQRQGGNASAALWTSLPRDGPSPLEALVCTLRSRHTTQMPRVTRGLRGAQVAAWPRTCETFSRNIRCRCPLDRPCAKQSISSRDATFIAFPGRRLRCVSSETLATTGRGLRPRRQRLQRRLSMRSDVSGHAPCTLTQTGMSRTHWGGQAARPRETVHRRPRIPATWTLLPSCAPQIRGATGWHPQGGPTGTQVKRRWRPVLEKQGVERRARAGTLQQSRLVGR